MGKFSSFYWKNDRLPELLEVIKNDLSLRKAMNINADDNNVEDDTEDNNLGENNFFKLWFNWYLLFIYLSVYDTLRVL